jgi:hypothetical protein
MKNEKQAMKNRAMEDDEICLLILYFSLPVFHSSFSPASAVK